MHKNFVEFPTPFCRRSYLLYPNIDRSIVYVMVSRVSTIGVGKSKYKRKLLKVIEYSDICSG